MTYIGRFFKWSFDSLVDLFRQGIIWTIRQALSVIRFALPIILRVVVLALGIALEMSILNLLALVRPMGDVAKRVGEDWSDKAVREGWVPSLHQHSFTRIFIVVAYFAMTVGLLINLFTVILTVDLVYYLITHL